MLDFQLEQLRQLPQRPNEVWQGALVRMPTWVTGEGPRPYRPWVALWLAVHDDRVHPAGMGMPGEEDPALLWAGLIELATDAEIGGYRPGRVELCDPVLAERFRPAAEAVGIELVCREALPELDRVVRTMAEDMAGGPLTPGWYSGEGVTAEHMRRFAEAARAFHEAAPWRHLSDEDLIAIEAPRPPSGMGYFSVLGNAGQTFGLGFHRSADARWVLQRTDDYAGWLSATQHGVWSLTFDEITDLPLEDAELWEDAHLPVADEHSYPALTHYAQATGASRPDAKRLTFVTRLLHALAQTTEQQLDQGRWSVTVPGARGQAKVTLALPDLLDPPDYQAWIQRGFEPDRRAMERTFAQMDRFMADKQFEDTDDLNAMIQAEFVGKAFDADRHPPRTPAEQAQDLCYQAFEAHGRRRVLLARQALGLDADCADAYTILAEHTADTDEAVELYAQGVAAGERALGPERFDEDAGHFWGQTDTRPYMRARFGLAHCLEAQGEVEAAIEHYRELLRLNPGDNQGVRYHYLPLLLEHGHDAEAARFMKQTGDEPTANWTYTRALLAYRLGGDTSTARDELRKAIAVNPHVIEWLAADEPPDELPPHYAIGTEEEAMICAHELGEAYRATPGAIEWLVQTHQKQQRAGSGRRPPKRRKRRSR